MSVLQNVDASSWQAIFAGLVCFFTGVGVGVAWRQLRHLYRPAQLEALRALYSYFDDESRRTDRRIIHGAILEAGSGPPPEKLDGETFGAIERMATSMDVVGMYVKKKLVDKDFVLERYVEVIIPMWEKCVPYIEHRRRSKGRGWEQFQLLYTIAIRYQKKKNVRKYIPFPPTT